MSLESSYQQFAIQEYLSFVEGEGSLPFIKVDNEYASALISIYGAQVLSYKLKPKNYVDDNVMSSSEMLFVSEQAYFEEGKAIKGGIPICWPWFGRDPENLGRQIHGFARNMFWQIESTSVTDEGATEIILSLSESKESYKHWPHDFKVELTITIGKKLHLSLQTSNTGKEAFKITQALHAYFLISEIQHVQLEGLDGVNYLDMVNGANKSLAQQDEITVNQEVDRIYENVPYYSTLVDKKAHRNVIISTKGSKTTVVWNPWIDISKSSGDLADDAYQRFICVETANAGEDVIVVEPNDSFTIEAEYSVT